jgi:hypothetical protein
VQVAEELVLVVFDPVAEAGALCVGWRSKSVLPSTMQKRSRGETDPMGVAVEVEALEVRDEPEDVALTFELIEEEVVDEGVGKRITEVTVALPGLPPEFLPPAPSNVAEPAVAPNGALTYEEPPPPPAG